MANSKLTTALLEQQFGFKQGYIGDAATPISQHVLKSSYTQSELDRTGAEIMVSNMKQLNGWLVKFPAIAKKLSITKHNPKDIGFDATFNGKSERFDFPFNTGAFFELLGLLPHQTKPLGESLLEQGLVGKLEKPRKAKKATMADLISYCDSADLDPDELFERSAMKTKRGFLEQFRDWCENHNTDEDEKSGRPYYEFSEYVIDDVSF